MYRTKIENTLVFFEKNFKKIKKKKNKILVTLKYKQFENIKKYKIFLKKIKPCNVKVEVGFYCG